MNDPGKITGIAAVLMALAVATGAFGAHALENVLTEDRLETWHTAVSYQFWNTLGLFCVVILSHLFKRPVKGPVLLILTGVVVFSGSLYTLCLTDAGIFGAITPFGGVAFIAGWLWFAVIMFRDPQETSTS